MTVEPSLQAPIRPIWARLAVDPVIMPLATRVSTWPGVTPNRVTALAGVLAAGSSVAFLLGHLRVGGALFLLRYAVDCLDGQVARVQRRPSAVGAALDLAVDVTGIAAIIGALSWYLIDQGLLSVATALALLAAVVVYNWALAYRKALAKSVGLVGDGGAGGTLSSDLPGLRRWSDLCRRLGMASLPWAVEVEILALGLVPLLLPTDWVPFGLVGALLFYLFADLVNLRRIWRLASTLDRTSRD